MSLLDLPQISNASKTVAPALDTLAKTGERESAAQFLPADIPAPVTQTEKANYDFYLQVQQIEGIQVRLGDGETWSERTIAVFVPDLFAQSTDDVINLEMRIHDLYPSARLHVQVWESATGL